jgi:hypothetical protein
VLPITLSLLTNLAVIDVSFNNLTGPITPDIIAWPAVFAASNNMFSGPLPAGEPFSGGQLFYFDVSHNQLSGVVPDLAATLGPQLSYVDLSSNAFAVPCNQTGFAMGVCLPQFIQLSTGSSDQLGGGVTCPRLVATDSDITVRVDPSYLQYKQCGCEPGYMQVNAQPLRCVLCAPTCQCLNGKVSGCYPTPFNGVWNDTLRCPIVNLASTACNPPALAANLSAALFVCGEGYSDRLCTRCDIGYYPSGRQCEACSPQLRWLLPMIYILLLTLLALYLIYVWLQAAFVLSVFLAQRV